MRLYDPRSDQLDHPGTFNNNVLSMSAGIAGCNLLSHDVLDDLNQLGRLMKHKIDKIFTINDISGTTPSGPIIDEASIPSSMAPPKMFITGAGSLMSIHFTGPEKQLLQGLFWQHMLQHGIYLAQRGFIALSIGINSHDVDQFVKAVEDFCQKWTRFLAKP